MGFQETFRALADPTRREILRILRDGAKSAGEIGSHFAMTGATISHHLSVLDEITGWIAGLKGGADDAQ